MKRIVFFLIFFSSLFSTLSAIEYKYKGNLGYLTDGLDDVKYKDAKLAFNLWLQELADKESIDAHIEYYDDVVKHREAYINNEFDYMTVNTYFYLEKRELYSSYTKEYWTVQKSDDLYQEYVVLTHKQSGKKSAKDLKGAVIESRSSDYLGRMVVDYMFLDSVKKNQEEYISEIQLTKKHSESILKVYFKKADACVVPLYALDIVNELNPDVGRKLQIVYRTPKIFIPLIGGFHKKTNPDIMKKFYENVIRLDQYVRGRNILDLFKMKKMLLIDEETLKPLVEFHERYISLKKRYARSEE